MAEDRVWMSRRLLTWYDAHRRDLPWRATGGDRFPDPWQVLVSEVMLQQTTVVTAGPYFRRFIERFPTAADLAGADEQEVLRLWQGLGYYARARNLRAAAIRLVADFGGVVPSDADQLLSLPGVGRYTAGAVGSLAFGQRVPIVDANVARVLCRLDRIETDPRTPATQRQLWGRATEILPAKRVGDFNSALMELGATICKPRNPLCGECPLKKTCRAFAADAQNDIPSPRRKKPKPLVKRQTFCVNDGQYWLIEQRPTNGRWGGMWQFVTVPADGTRLTASKVSRRIGMSVRTPKLIGSVEHALSHRQYHFDVFMCSTTQSSGARQKDLPNRRWVLFERLADYPMPRPHVKMAAMVREIREHAA